MEWGHIGKEHTWSGNKYGEGTHTDIWSGGIHRGRTHIQWRHIRGGNIHRDEIYIERGHTWKKDTHRHIEWGYTWRRDTHRVGTHTGSRHTWSGDIHGEGTHKDGIYTERGHTKSHGVGTHTKKEQIWR